MTVTVQNPRVVFSGSAGGSRGPFELRDTNGNPVQAQKSTHLKVTRYASEAAASGTLLVLGTDYTVSGIPQSPQVLLTTSATGLLESEKLVIEREQPIQQTLHIGAGTPVKATDTERTFDTLVEILQEQAARLNELRSAAGGGFSPDFGISATADTDLAKKFTDALGLALPLEDGADVLSSGAGYVELHDNTVRMYGETATITAGNTLTVTLPVTSSNTTYKVSATSLGSSDARASITTRSATSFGLKCHGNDSAFSWIIEGAAL